MAIGPRTKVAGLGLEEAAAAIAAGELSSVALVRTCLDRAKEVEPVVHAFAWLDEDRAMRLARDAADADQRGPLHGVPVGIKDIIDTAGIPTEYGTGLLAGRVPDESADVVAALEAAGAIVLGKTVTAELAYFSPGPTRNPWDVGRTPGGSSMGSAAAVAARILPGAIGTQTNGSVIRPAAFCGVVGYKPTAGSLSGRGVMTFSETLDQIGAIARSVRDVAALVVAMGGTMAGPADRQRGDDAPRFAVARTIEWRHAEPAMRERFDADIDALRRSGAEIEEPDLPPGLEESVPVHRTIMAVEGARNLGPVVARAPERVSRVLRDLLDEGARTDPADYRDALRRRSALVAEFAAWAADYDAILTPPATGEAPTPETTGDPRFCTRWTLVGAPALVLPTGLGPTGLPLGLQIVGSPKADMRLLTAAAWIESRVAFRESPRI